MDALIIIVTGVDEQTMGMVFYSLLLGLTLVASAPVWGWRMVRQHRYRAGLAQRLGQIPAQVADATSGMRVVWVHAVSVGEVLAAERLVRELGEALGESWKVIVSTTTETGQKVARERFGTERVIYWPLDFGWAVRKFLRIFRPELLVLVESELWPRMLHECQRSGVPVVVVNARVSDRSFNRARRVRPVWRWMACQAIFFAQGQETAARLRMLGAAQARVLGNLKFDLLPVSDNAVASRIASLTHGRRVVVAGSTLAGEENLILQAWRIVLQAEPGAVLVLAPRHTPRFPEVLSLLASQGWQTVRASQKTLQTDLPEKAVVLLDTLGDLASVYGLADVAFVGGSLVSQGGHNPLEAARFGVPVIMGPSYENFREMVDGMRADEAIRIVEPGELGSTLRELLKNEEGMGERGRVFFESQSGATARTVAALWKILHA